MKAYLNAVPPYLGGKRKIARDIMTVIQTDYGVEPGAAIADAFMGGAAVSVAAKALGYKVIGNDRGPIAVATGKALVENGTRTISVAELTMAIEHDPIGNLPDEKELSIPVECRELLASRGCAVRR